MTEIIKEKRTWVFIQSPRDYEIAPCSCGNQETQWSEYEKHIWCAKCEIDFIPEHNGIFDGPIMINTAQMLGLHFTKVDLLTNDILVLDSDHEHVKCLNFKDCFESHLVPVNLKGVRSYKQDKIITATANLNYKTFLLENISLLEPTTAYTALDHQITTELIFNFPHKDTFKINFKINEGKYELQENKQATEFKQYIMHEHLQTELGFRKTPANRKI